MNPNPDILQDEEQQELYKKLNQTLAQLVDHSLLPPEDNKDS